MIRESLSACGSMAKGLSKDPVFWWENGLEFPRYFASIGNDDCFARTGHWGRGRGRETMPLRTEARWEGARNEGSSRGEGRIPRRRTEECLVGDGRVKPGRRVELEKRWKKKAEELRTF